MRARWVSPAAAALVLGVHGCTEVCACPPAIAVAVVTGAVRQGDSPVPAARVHSFSAEGAGCQSLGFSFDDAITGPDGRFLTQLVASPGLQDICVYVFARADGTADDAMDSDTALVILDFPDDTAPDTAHITLALPLP